MDILTALFILLLFLPVFDTPVLVAYSSNWGSFCIQEINKSIMNRVKSGYFEHKVNSDVHLQTVEIQIRRLLMSRLIRIFTVCFYNLLFHSNK